LSPKKDNSLEVDLERRLDDFFEENVERPGSLESDSNSKLDPIRVLKTIVLSIDWEISDETMGRFVEHVDRLKQTHKDDSTLLILLKLLGSVGKYIMTNKGKSHPDAIKVLNSVYGSLETFVNSDRLTEVQRKKILLTEMNKFKELKSKIALQKDTKVSKIKEKSLDRIKTSLCHDSVIQAIDEIKQIIRDEFIALKKELQLLHNGQ
jgi:hypothetical protein